MKAARYSYIFKLISDCSRRSTLHFICVYFLCMCNECMYVCVMYVRGLCINITIHVCAPFYNPHLPPPCTQVALMNACVCAHVCIHVCVYVRVRAGGIG